MAEHIIPDGEEDEHIRSPDCPCEPKLIVHEESGELIWLHRIQDVMNFIKNIFSF